MKIENPYYVTGCQSGQSEKREVNIPEVDPIPEALMAAAVAAAEAAGKLPRAAGTSGVRKTPEKELGYCHFDLRKMPEEKVNINCIFAASGASKISSK